MPPPGGQPNRTMRFVFRLLLLCLTCAATGAWAAAPLVNPAQAKALGEGGARLIDVREASAYAMQHVPGAVSAPYPRWRLPGANPGLPPAPADLTALVQELGLTADTPVVVIYTGIDGTDFGGAARVYWTLKSLGVQQLSILNGGLTAWKAAGLPVSNQASAAARSAWKPQFNPQWMATREQVRASLEQAGVLRVDARPAPFFQGRIAADAAHARGTLPGAVNLDSENWFELGSAALMDKASLQDEADKLNAAPAQPIIAFCNAGHWSATDWFVLSEVLGRTNVRMYPGSIIDWTAASAPLPMDNEPGRWQQLRYAALSWAHRNFGTKAP